MIREVRALRKNGEEFDCEIAMSEVGTSAGSQRLFTVVMRDITERKLAEEAEAKAERIEQLEKELRSLEQLSSPAQTTVTAQMFGLASLRESVPDTFKQMVERYGALIELALEQRAYRVNHNIPEELRLLAEELGYLKGGPRDVVEIHSTALKIKTKGVTPQKAQAYAEEGRLMLLEFMGYLTSYYRNYASGVSTAHAPAITAAKISRKQGGTHE